MVFYAIVGMAFVVVRSTGTERGVQVSVTAFPVLVPK